MLSWIEKQATAASVLIGNLVNYIKDFFKVINFFKFAGNLVFVRKSEKSLNKQATASGPPGPGPGAAGKNALPWVTGACQCSDFLACPG